MLVYILATKAANSRTLRLVWDKIWLGDNARIWVIRIIVFLLRRHFWCSVSYSCFFTKLILFNLWWRRPRYFGVRHLSSTSLYNMLGVILNAIVNYDDIFPLILRVHIIMARDPLFQLFNCYHRINPHLEYLLGLLVIHWQDVSHIKSWSECPWTWFNENLWVALFWLLRLALYWLLFIIIKLFVR